MLDRVLGGLAALILFAMMALTFVDVWGRYIFSAPVPGGFEITELMMAVLIFAGLPVVTHRDQHVTIDMLDWLVPAALRRWQQAFMNLVCAVAMGVISWRMWVKANQSVAYGDITATLNIHYAPFVYFMAAATAVTTVILLIKVFQPPAGGHGAGNV